jgi:hypothetical protein
LCGESGEERKKTMDYAGNDQLKWKNEGNGRVSVMKKKL